MKRIAIITGASSGFGKEFALQLDKQFACIDEYWLISRSEQKLHLVANELNNMTKVMSLDLTKTESINKIVEEVKKEHAVIKILVNSAGFGKIGDVKHMNDDSIEDMITLNCTSLALLTKKLIPHMDDNSRIINIASSAAFLPQPKFSIYAATKSFVLSFTRSLNSELRNRDIFATAVCPGPSETNFFVVAEEKEETPAIKKFFKAAPEKIVALAIKDAINKEEVSVYGIFMKSFRILCKIIPHGLILKFY